MNGKLAALLLGFLLLSTLYNASVPLGEGPDEPGHFAYVLFLAREGRLPRQSSDPSTSEVPGEGHQPPLAYLLMLPAAVWLPPEARQIEQTANPHFLWNGGSEPNAYTRASREYWPWQGATLAWHLARVLSALPGLLLLLCVWGAARALADNANEQPAWALLAVALVAFNPQFLFTSALVTNDTLLAALSAGMLWLCLKDVSPTPAALLRHAAAAGSLLGLALLAKQSAFLLVPLLLWKSWHATRAKPRMLALHLPAWAGVALLLAGWWYARNWYLYGDPMGLHIFRTTFTTHPFQWHSPSEWVGALRQLHDSSWALFGWLSLPAPRPLIWFYGALELAAIAGWVILLRHARSSFSNPTRWFGLLLLVLLTFAWCAAFALTAGMVAWQGRLLFPALPAFAIVLARGLAVLPPRMLFPALPAVLALLACFLLLNTIAPAYPWHTLPPHEAQERIAFPSYARYAKEWERGVELRGYALDAEREHILPAIPEPGLEPGQVITLTLTWHALEPIPHDRVVFVHLVNKKGAIVAEHNSRPQQGAFPLALWTSGDWVEDPHPLALPPDLHPGRYRLRVGFWRAPFQGKRVPAWDRSGSPIGDSVDIGTLTITPTAPSP